MLIRGVTKEITLPVTHLGKIKDPWGNEKIGFEAEITLNRKDFGLKWNARPLRLDDASGRPARLARKISCLFRF